LATGSIRPKSGLQKESKIEEGHLMPGHVHMSIPTPPTVEAFDSVFDAPADTPAEAATMTARADLLLAIRKRVKA
jgi:hypothetical protein